MDAYSGYNQILMNPPDQEHTAFTMNRGLYCYKVMPFGLTNARVTYQRLVNSMFAEQIGKSMEVYVDDMLVKSKHDDQYIANLSETFTILKRFISKAIDKCALFFKALKGSKKYITWTDKSAEAFKNLKDYMSKAPLLSKLEVDDTFIIYLSISASAVSFVLIQKDGNVERPVYYANKALQDAETQYSNIEKLALALGCGAGLVLTTLDKVAIEYALRFKFKASNNEAEYETLLAGLRLAKHLGVKRIDIFSDSQLVVNQVTNNFDAKDSSMATYLAQTQLLLKHFHYQITQIPRATNSHANALARLASAVEDKIGRKIQVKLLATPSTMATEVCNLQ
ncbi:hypothetical protein ACFX14_007168 [Malus domestica]